ncbi:hypothetical protein EBT25_06625, partial [bacterium]|nr:hypothetical protein [bacterium]
VRCADQWLAILELQLEGKKKMDTTEFLRGLKTQAPGTQGCRFFSKQPK